MENARQKILIVDDTPENITVLMETLRDEYAVVAAINGEKALKMAAADPPPDIVLLDVMMPGLSGYEVCARLKEDPKTNSIPVIFVTALGEADDEAKGLDLGVVDYIVKPFSPKLVKARVRNQLELKRHRDNLEALIQERTAELAALNAIYERFVPEEFISLLGKKSIMEIKLGDQIKQEMTVMFADVRGWTTLSETMTPQENFNFINAYLKRVSPTIRDNRGFIDQYYGDGVMALFPGRADDAVGAAIAMHKAVADYNSERQQDGFLPIGIGVGLHIGNLMLGIIGSEDRLQGAVVADAVNLTARIEGLTKVYGASITISEEVLSHLEHPDKYNHRFVDKVMVKGKDTPVTVYEIFDGDDEMMVQLKKETKSNFEEGLTLYYDRKFAEASVQFNQVLQKNKEDIAARIYLTRSAKYMIAGVPEDWTGIEVLTSK
jgi:two-component system sensor histidine kinase ChiS